ncbi:N-acetylglucosamine-6-phosphate deacetylase [Niveispirillum fermenti]|uniref:N-acetylglucosamine-6-phosphate deacetylase n=1 Tax=Niveispirillum fermenti TaxID=1233113 RepID=UPI003A8B2BEB
MAETLLTGARVFTGSHMVAADILLRADRVAALLPPGSPLPEGAALRRLSDGMLLAPGFIDTQVNGGGGILFNDQATVQAALSIARAHRRFGTTALLPTFITDTVEGMRAAGRAAAVASAMPGSGVVGVHLEGPFLAPERRGVHSLAHVRPIDAADLDFLTGLPARFGADARVLLSLAPDRVEPAVVARLVAAGLIVAGAHSAATYAQTMAAVEAGLSGFTHLFNAMPPLANREPGIAGAALAARDTVCGIIADGVHVHPAMLRLALAAKGPGGLMLVTDAMPPTGTAAESFTLHGQMIHRRDGRLVTDDGTLAGADIDMAQAVRNAVALMGVGLEEALRMASLYPARFLRLDDRLGRIRAGYQADLVLLDADLQVAGTWVAGQWWDATANEGEAGT